MKKLIDLVKTIKLIQLMRYDIGCSKMFCVSIFLLVYREDLIAIQVNDEFFIVLQPVIIEADEITRLEGANLEGTTD